MNQDSLYPSRLLVAIGGNATHPLDMRGTPDEQARVAIKTGKSLLPLLELDNQLVITHGNGPTVGKIHMHQALSRDRVTPMPLDICVAHSQGGIAYLLLQAFENALRESGNPRHVVCLLTQVEVDPDDSGFQNPSKPIGDFYTEEEARNFEGEMGWTMQNDEGRGWRHFVASPEPKHIVDISLVRGIMESGAVCIAGGGGGIPVVRDPQGVREGLEAVIEKDLTSALMANVLGIETMMILTDVPHVATHFRTSRQQNLERLTLSELCAFRDEGHFPPRNMGPKIDAAIRFLERGGKHVVIAHLEEALPALEGKTGTHIVPD